MNRNERIADNNSTYVPTLAIATHLASINDMAKDVKYREDVIKSITASASALTIDFSDTDRYEVDAATFAVDLTINGTNDGDVKYLLITKQSGKTFTFSGATSQAVNVDYVNSAISLLFRIINKKSFIYAELVNKSFDKATQLEVDAGTNTDNYVTPAHLNGTDWVGVSEYGTGWTGDVFCRLLDKYTLILTGIVLSSGATSGNYVLRLPIGFRPIRVDFEMVLKEYGTITNVNYRMSFLDGLDSGWLFQTTSTSADPSDRISFYHVFKFL